MDREKLEAAKSLESEIKKIVEYLDGTESVKKASIGSKDSCYLIVMYRQEKIRIDQDIFGIALTLYKDRLSDKLLKLKKEFESL